MKLSELNDWLSLAANFGVLIGLIFLIVEINQSNTMAEVAAYQARSSAIETGNRDLATNPQLAALLVKVRSEGVDSLDPVEKLQVSQWFFGVIRRMQNQYYQYQRGFLEESAANSMLDSAARAYDGWVELDLLGAIDNENFLQEIQLRREALNLTTGN